MLAVEVNSLVKEFGKKNKPKFVAVDNISFSIKPGEKVAIVGPNGAGKTTTLMMMLGLMLPTSGTVHIFGSESEKRNIGAIKNIGFCAGYSNLNTDRTVRQVLTYFAMVSDVPDYKKSVDKILDELGIQHLSEKKCNGLSSGQGTLVSVAKSLVGNPKLVIMDEPTAFTDPEVSRRIQSVIDKYNNEYNTTVLITSHDMEEVERICDRVIFISSGKVALDAKPQTLKQKTGFSTLEEAWLSFAKEHQNEYDSEQEI